MLIIKVRPRLNDGFVGQVTDMVFFVAKEKVSSKFYLKRMYFCFAMGVIIGIGLTMVLPDFSVGFVDWHFSINKFVLQLPLVFILLFLFHKTHNIKLFWYGKEKYL